LHLTLPDAKQRAGAVAFIKSIIDLAGPLGASAIIGSMQGRSEGAVSREDAFRWLAEGLNELGEHARQYNVPMFFEPINRYETNLLNAVEAGAAFIDTLSTRNVKLLADLFHMNIEDVDIAGALRAAGPRIGHLHFVDSNRRPAGCGHLDYGPIAAALADIGYSGYASAEALSWPDPDAAGAKTIESFRRYFRS
jgi:sugar phosphate isomerase/epimerase